MNSIRVYQRFIPYKDTPNKLQTICLDILDTLESYLDTTYTTQDRIEILEECIEYLRIKEGT